MSIPERVISYIDGFNLYHGLRDAYGRRYLWLNLQRLSRKLLKPNQVLTVTKYFTAIVIDSPAKSKRQTTYIDALKTLEDFEIHYGHFQKNPSTCSNCGYTTTLPCEKLTDVNIAVELLKDAHLDRFDTALIISADSDLAPAIQTVLELFPGKRAILAFPPKRASKHLQKIASGLIHVSRDAIEKSQFADAITTESGYTLVRPALWH